ncbi:MULTISPECIES: hypothetical protein [Bacillaceae]|uniref:Uncharacterized protein n=1 Tax=Alkalicoccobacillus plakortidis TaxID=444060 RepID=A0A9D5I1J6_9BACI|nr:MULTISPECIES: hypothetical protein [Bacillaceae]KQL56603.1 hypothetical protein AN965_12860 [Alkalicoccobacillus plakortidis]
MIVFQLFLLASAAFLIYISQRKKLTGDRKMSIFFFTILGIGLFYGSTYILQIDIPSFANKMTSIVKSLQGIKT